MFIILIFTILFIFDVKCDENKVKFFGISSLTTLQLIDSILVHPDILEKLVIDTNFFRIDETSWLNKNFYVINLINFLKKNGFDDYQIFEINVEGFKDSKGMLSVKLYYDIISKKNKSKIMIDLDIIQPEAKWKINTIDILKQ